METNTSIDQLCKKYEKFHQRTTGVVCNKILFQGKKMFIGNKFNLMILKGQFQNAKQI